MMTFLLIFPPHLHLYPITSISFIVIYHECRHSFSIGLNIYFYGSECRPEFLAGKIDHFIDLGIRMVRIQVGKE